MLMKLISYCSSPAAAHASSKKHVPGTFIPTAGYFMKCITSFEVYYLWSCHEFKLPLPQDTCAQLNLPKTFLNPNRNILARRCVS